MCKNILDNIHFSACHCSKSSRGIMKMCFSLANCLHVTKMFLTAIWKRCLPLDRLLWWLLRTAGFAHSFRTVWGNPPCKCKLFGLVFTRTCCSFLEFTLSRCLSCLTLFHNWLWKANSVDKSDLRDRRLNLAMTCYSLIKQNVDLWGLIQLKEEWFGLTPYVI